MQNRVCPFYILPHIHNGSRFTIHQMLPTAMFNFSFKQEMVALEVEYGSTVVWLCRKTNLVCLYLLDSFPACLGFALQKVENHCGYWIGINAALEICSVCYLYVEVGT